MDHCPKNFHHRGKDCCMAGLQFKWIGYDKTRKYVIIFMYWILTSKTGGQLYIDTSLSRLGSYWPCKVSQIASYLVLVFSSFLSRQHWHEVKEKGPSQNVYVKKNLLPTVSWGNVKFPLFGCPCFTLLPVQSNWDYVMCPFFELKI